MREYEAVYPDIDLKAIRKKLKSIGAKQDFKRSYRWLNFEYPDWRLDSNHSWIRLRDEGDKITLSFKKRIGPGQGQHGNDLGMEENEIIVDSFDKAKDFFLSIGFVIKYDMEKTREHWTLADIIFDIDTYPLIPTLLEVESSSWPKVDTGIKLLGLDPSKKKIMTAYQIFGDYGHNPKDYQVIHFDKQIKR